MKDWKAIAQASGLQIPDHEMERVSGPLNALEEAFRPLVKNLAVELEPALIFDAAEEGE